MGVFYRQNRAGKFVEVGSPEDDGGPIETRGAGIHVIGDTMEPLRHPVTGRIHDSKSTFRRETKAAGCIEVGNEPIRQTKPRLEGVREAVIESFKKYEGY